MADDSQGPKTLAEAFALANSPGTLLPERLAAYARYTDALAPDISAAYDRMSARLATTDWHELGPQIGDAMPPFVLPDHTGHLVSLEGLLGHGPLVVSFNRGHWCPYCRMELKELARMERSCPLWVPPIVSIRPGARTVHHKTGRRSGNCRSVF